MAIAAALAATLVSAAPVRLKPDTTNPKVRGVRLQADREEVRGHSVYRELELYVEAGFTPMEALQAATIVPARAMKLDREVGTIGRGKHADLVVFNANPLESIRNIRAVRWTIRDGRVYDAPALWKSVRFQP